MTVKCRVKKEGSAKNKEKGIRIHGNTQKHKCLNKYLAVVSGSLISFFSDVVSVTLLSRFGLQLSPIQLIICTSIDNLNARQEMFIIARHFSGSNRNIVKDKCVGD